MCLKHSFGKLDQRTITKKLKESIEVEDNESAAIPND
jgi:hypothetical protein